MPFDFLCPACRQSLNASEALVGQRLPCPYCQTVILVPAPPEAPPGYAAAPAAEAAPSFAVPPLPEQAPPPTPPAPAPGLGLPDWSALAAQVQPAAPAGVGPVPAAPEAPAWPQTPPAAPGPAPQAPPAFAGPAAPVVGPAPTPPAPAPGPGLPDWSALAAQVQPAAPAGVGPVPAAPEAPAWPQAAPAAPGSAPQAPPAFAGPAAPVVGPAPVPPAPAPGPGLPDWSALAAQVQPAAPAGVGPVPAAPEAPAWPQTPPAAPGPAPQAPPAFAGPAAPGPFGTPQPFGLPPPEASASDIAALAEGRRPSGRRSLAIILASLISVSVIGVLYWQLVLRKASVSVDTDTRTTKWVAVPSANMLTLGGALTIDSIRVVPERVVARKVKLRHFSGSVKTSETKVLVLYMKITNTGDKQMFPYPPEVAFDDRNTFITKPDRPTPFIRNYELTANSEFTIEDQNCTEELQAGQTMVYLAVAEEGSAEKAKKYDGEMIWRVLLQTQPPAAGSSRGRTALIGVRFNANNIAME